MGGDRQMDAILEPRRPEMHRNRKPERGKAGEADGARHDQGQPGGDKERRNRCGDPYDAASVSALVEEDRLLEAGRRPPRMRTGRLAWRHRARSWRSAQAFWGALRRPLNPGKHFLTMRAIALLGLIALGACAVAIAVGAAGSTDLVPAAGHTYPGWLAGPFSFVDAGLGQTAFDLLLVGMSVGYVLVLAGVRTLGARSVLIAILGLHLVFLAAPPLFSADVFGYVVFARLGALHGL